MTVNIQTGLEKVQLVMKGCIENEIRENGLLEDVESFFTVWNNEDHVEEPVIWMYQHETRAGRQADISHTMDLTIPFQFNCSVYKPELEDANTATQNLATRVILSILRNWQTVQAEIMQDNGRIIRNITLETFYPLGTIDVNNKSERLPVIGVLLNVSIIVNWKMCCKNLGD